jgi:hypothetical protein
MDKLLLMILVLPQIGIIMVGHSSFYTSLAVALTFSAIDLAVITFLPTNQTLKPY